MSNIVPTPEDAAAAHRTLRRLTDPPEGAFLGATLAQHTAASTVLPLLEAIADGRVFEVRAERCTECTGLECRILNYMASHKQPLSAGEIRDGLGANFGVVGTQLIQMANAGTVAVTSEGHGNEYSLPEPANNSNTQ